MYPGVVAFMQLLNNVFIHLIYVVHLCVFIYMYVSLSHSIFHKCKNILLFNRKYSGVISRTTSQFTQHCMGAKTMTPGPTIPD